MNVFGQVGGNGGQSGGVDEFSRFAGSYPHRLWSKRGNPFAPSSAAVPLGPRMYSAKKNGVRARHELRVFADTPKWPKNQGLYPPFDHFPLCNIYFLGVGNTPYWKCHTSRTIHVKPLHSILEERFNLRQSFWCCSTDRSVRRMLQPEKRLRDERYK